MCWPSGALGVGVDLGEMAEEWRCRVSRGTWAEAAPRGWQSAHEQGLTFLKWMVNNCVHV